MTVSSFCRTASLAVLSLLGAGCAAVKPLVPIAMPQPSVLVREAEASTELRSTIVGGEAPVPSAPRPAAARPRGGDIAFNFPMADVAIVAKSVLGDVLRTNYVIAPGVTAQISFVTPGRVARGSVLGLFETALKNAGLALTPMASGYLIQPVTSAQAPVNADAIGFGAEILTLQFINADELKKLLDSVLPGVVTATDSTRNAVTISGTTGQRTSARDLIAQFDVNWLRNMSFALLVPQRTDSRLIVPELEKLINAPDAPTRGLVRLIQMERLNGILAISAQQQYLEDVRRWIDILDREGASNEPKLFVYRVQNGRARDLVKTLNGAFGIASDSSSGGSVDPLAAQNELSTTQNAPRPTATANTPGPNSREAVGTATTSASGAGSTAGSFAGRISSDEVNNAVVVFGAPRDFAIVEDAMRKLDVPPTQVLIEAAITEVALTGDLSYGVDWNFIQGNSNFVSGAGTPAAPAANAAGFAYFLRTSDISATLRALESRTNIKVISAPKLLVLNNQTAALQVGNQVPIQTQQQQAVGTGNGNIVNSIEYRDTGVILRVTPRVNASGLVLLDISQEVSSVSSLSTGGIDSPTIATRRIATTVAVQDGQVLGLGGLFSDSKTNGNTGLPLLTRIPILGALFGRATAAQERRELIILIKPQIIRTPIDGQKITEELRSKLRTLEPFRTEGRIP